MSSDSSHIKDYIELEKMRFNDSLLINFQTENILEDSKIAPMLLLPFIENSFKHGVSNKVSDKWIKIDLSVSEKILLLNIENSKNSKDSICRPLRSLYNLRQFAEFK